MRLEISLIFNENEKMLTNLIFLALQRVFLTQNDRGFKFSYQILIGNLIVFAYNSRINDYFRLEILPMSMSGPTLAIFKLSSA